MKLEWSDAALADLNRFAEFLNREHPSLAANVATEIIRKADVLSEHPRLGRPISGREEYRQVVLQVLGAAYVLPLRRTTSCDVAGVSCPRGKRISGSTSQIGCAIQRKKRLISPGGRVTPDGVSASSSGAMQR